MKLAVYTTIYPGVEPFLEDWMESVRHQDQQGFDVWVGIDGFSLEQAQSLFKAFSVKNFVMNDKQGSKAGIRIKALEKIVVDYDAVVLVDSDDILKTDRVFAAQQNLRDYDAVASAMALVDERGCHMAARFGRSRSGFTEKDIIEFNQFGLSNTAYRTAILKRCLNAPDDCELFDWYLVTSAWAQGARLYFDAEAQMDYRQHGTNATKVMPPFSIKEVSDATDHVLKHFIEVLHNTSCYKDERLKVIENRYNAVRQFKNKVVNNTVLCKRYVDAFNKLPHDVLWWSCVANPSLEEIWKS